MSDLAEIIANTLGEFIVRPFETVVETLGEEAAKQILADTLRIEENGGLMTARGDRRRTPGGVFLFLAIQRYKEPIKHHKKSKSPLLLQVRGKPIKVIEKETYMILVFEWPKFHESSKPLRDVPNPTPRQILCLVGKEIWKTHLKGHDRLYICGMPGISKHGILLHATYAISQDARE